MKFLDMGELELIIPVLKNMFHLAINPGGWVPWDDDHYLR
jgi:hypothetical protein